jgi:hypothetical protein
MENFGIHLEPVRAIMFQIGAFLPRLLIAVVVVIAGWLASTLQQMGMPGMDDAGARQDFMGRVLTQLDGMQQGGGEQQPEAAPDPAQQQQAPPMAQFGGA